MSWTMGFVDLACDAGGVDDGVIALAAPVASASESDACMGVSVVGAAAAAVFVGVWGDANAIVLGGGDVESLRVVRPLWPGQ